MKINVDVNAKNWLIKVYVVKELFGIPVIVSVNVTIVIYITIITIITNITIVHVKKSAHRIHFPCMSKHKEKKLMNNSNLSDKEGIL